jgi:UDP-N-acetylglucosamine--N-acetylmuramyl-(pentapeptide) pyrophosphoryl-undecaprenol N-acetylglucosamine transferase
LRVVIGSGGTAGHVFPALSTAERLRDRLSAEVTFVGTTDGQEARMVPRAGFRLDTVEAIPFRRRLSLDTLRAPFAALRAAQMCRPNIRDADAIVGMGGYVSVPVSLAARLERVPLVLHEQNAAPGLANRVAARWAEAVAVGFKEAAVRFRHRRTVVTGNPVRDEVLRVREDRDALRAQARASFDLQSGRWTVVAFGGSQGARRMNEALLGALTGSLAGRGDIQVLWVTGPSHHDALRERIPEGASILVRTAAFIDRMELAYALADLAVCRAGASTIAELSVSGVPAIMVPYPFATGRHQELNASALARAGGAVVVPDGDLTPERLASEIMDLGDDPQLLDEMRRRSLTYGRPDAADALAELVASIAKGAQAR